MACATTFPFPCGRVDLHARAGTLTLARTCVVGLIVLVLAEIELKTWRTCKCRACRPALRVWRRGCPAVLGWRQRGTVALIFDAIAVARPAARSNSSVTHRERDGRP